MGLRDDALDDRVTELRGSAFRVPDHAALCQAIVIGPPGKADPAVEDHAGEVCAFCRFTSRCDQLAAHQMRCDGQHHRGLVFARMNVHA